MDASNQYLSMLDVSGRMRLTSARLYQLISEDRFPRPIKRGRRSFWIASEIEQVANRWHQLKPA